MEIEKDFYEELAGVYELRDLKLKREHPEIGGGPDGVVIYEKDPKKGERVIHYNSRNDSIDSEKEWELIKIRL